MDLVDMVNIILDNVNLHLFKIKKSNVIIIMIYLVQYTYCPSKLCDFIPVVIVHYRSCHILRLLCVILRLLSCPCSRHCCPCPCLVSCLVSELFVLSICPYVFSPKFFLPMSMSMSMSNIVLMIANE